MSNLIMPDSICVLKPVLKDRVISALCSFLNQPTVVNYCEFYAQMVENNAIERLKEYIDELVLYTKTPFSESVKTGNKKECVVDAAKKDLDVLMKMGSLSCEELVSMINEKHNKLPWFVEKTEFVEINNIYGLMKKYQHNGTGLYAKYSQFIWENGELHAVLEPDEIRLTDFIGYEIQRNKVVDNTKRLLEGKTANNVLLYGDRGTGKSSTVKAIANEFKDDGLRIIELPKNQMNDFAKILKTIKYSVCKFIIFIDDLSFENNERDVAMLKALLEGGLEAKPSNTVIYATSNRRNLIKETFRDRQSMLSSSPDEEVHASDNMQEKLSLADRFGLRVTFSAPNQNDYLDIVVGIARKKGVSVTEEEVKRQALVWEMKNNGKSPRTAKQFVDSL